LPIFIAEQVFFKRFLEIQALFCLIISLVDLRSYVDQVKPAKLCIADDIRLYRAICPILIPQCGR
jgi:hypothetical protein